MKKDVLDKILIVEDGKQEVESIEKNPKKFRGRETPSLP